LGVKVELVPGAGGVFDVLADGVLLFSKFRAGRFPEPAEIETLIKKIGS